MDSTNANEGSDSQNIAARGAAVLLVIGEPFSEEHKKLIQAEVTKGFRSWDVDAIGVDINDELAQIANKADLGEEGPNGERIIRHNSEKVAVEILVNPQTQTVTLAVKNFLATPTKHKHLIYAGHAYQGSGAWILQDDTFTFNNFAHAFKDQDVGNAVRQQKGSSLYIYTKEEGDWSNGHINKAEFSKLLEVKLNPSEKLETIHGVLQFTAYVSNFVRVRPLNELLQSTDVVGNIRFSRPTLYIFPGCQGDSALFGISGFNLLVNGGYSKKACFWDFTRHLDRIDAALMTHLGADNLFGFSSVLQRKSIENVHPEIGFMYVNGTDKVKPLTQSVENKDESLMINLAEEGNKLLQYAKQIGQFPHPCTRNQAGHTIEPINLYHKVGIGSLDMYILNPITDSKEMKDFYQQWNQRVAQFGTNQHVPLPNTLSVCALLVWQPSDPNDNITRIFFPGNAPQHKVIEGLEKLKSLDILKVPTCTKISLTAKPATKKPSALHSKPPTKAKVSPVNTPRNEVPRKEEKKEIHPPKKEEKKELPPPKKASTPKAKPAFAPKAKKEDVNKKTSSKVADKAPKEEKADKSKSSTSSSPSKSSSKSITPTTPKQLISPEKAPEVQQESLFNDSSVDPPGFTGDLLEPTQVTAQHEEPKAEEPPAPVPETEPFAHMEQTGAIDRNQMLELGIYDEDHDIEEDLNAQSNEEEEQQGRVPQLYGGMEDSMHEDLIGDMNTMNAMQGSIHGDLMSGSMVDYGCGLNQNGGTSVDDLMTPDDDTSEEIQPQALPEPMAYAPSSYGQEPDVIPSMNLKDEPAELAEPESLTPSTQEPDLLPVKQDTHEDVSASQDLDEDSTVPVEAVQSGVNVATPDEVENNLPQDEGVCQGIPDQHTEDIQEKDVMEETEKELVAPHEPIMEPTISAEQDKVVEQISAEQEEVREQSLALSPEPEMEPELMLEREEMREQSPEMSHEPVMEPEMYVEQQQVREDSPDLSKEVDLSPESEEVLDVKNYFPTADDYAETPQKSDLLSAPEQELDREPSPEISLEPEMQHQMERSESPEEREDFIERPQTPEPVEIEQDRSEQLETDVPAESADHVSEHEESPEAVEEERVSKEVENVEHEMIENDFKDGEGKKEIDEPIPAQQLEQPPIFDDKLAKFSPRPETPESDRAESPDSQVDARDSLERELREQSPQPMADQEEHRDSIEREQRDSIERDTEHYEEEAAPEDAQAEQRDSIERDAKEDSPMFGHEDDQAEQRDSIERAAEQNAKEDSTMFGHEVDQAEHRDRIERDAEQAEQRDSIERDAEQAEQKGSIERDAEQAKQRDSIERDAEQNAKEDSPMSGQGEQRDSVERSFEDDSEDTEETEDEDEDAESSSFEQEEATDERCLIPDSVGDGQKGDHFDGKGMETDSLNAPDSLVEQHSSDNLPTPESELTDPSHGGQLGYHQVGDQEDGDSVEGIDEHDAFAAPPPHQSYPFGQDFEQFGAPAHPSGPMSTNPFDTLGQPEGQSGLNPFVGMDEQNVPQYQRDYDDSSPEPEDDFGHSGGPAGFNPLAEWGEPMGLPSPPPPEQKADGVAAAKKSPRPKSGSKLEDKKATSDAKKPSSLNKRTTSAPTKPSNGVTEKKAALAKTAPKPSNGVPEKTKSRPSAGGTNITLNTSRSSPGSNTTTSSRLSMGGKTAPKPRPATAPAKDKPAEVKNKTNGDKRPATATGHNRASPAPAKMPPLPAFTPFYMDLTYIPNHGNPLYSDIEFFKRIRARYYVLSTLTPNTQILDSLLEAKKTWEDQDLNVTVIPTYDNETLRLWMSLHKEKLADQKVEIAPSASRCTIQLQDHETSSSAYRLEF